MIADSDLLQRLQTLSPAEYELFLELGEGHNLRPLAKQWRRSVKTLESYFARTKGKLGLATGQELRAEAARFVALYGQPKRSPSPESRYLFDPPLCPR